MRRSVLAVLVLSLLGVNATLTLLFKAATLDL